MLMPDALKKVQDTSAIPRLICACLRLSHRIIDTITYTLSHLQVSMKNEV